MMCFTLPKSNKTLRQSVEVAANIPSLLCLLYIPRFTIFDHSLLKFPSLRYDSEMRRDGTRTVAETDAAGSEALKGGIAGAVKV